MDSELRNLAAQLEKALAEAREAVGLARQARNSYDIWRHAKYSPDSVGFWAELTEEEPPQDGTNFRWFYSWRNLTKIASGYGGWSVTGTVGNLANGNPGYNTIEDTNGGTGSVVFGNGTDPANFLGTFRLRPAGKGAIVWMRKVTVFATSGSPTTEYWFQYENAVDGSCDDS